MNRKDIRVVLIALSGALILSQYQNCSPAGSHTSAPAEGDTVRVIEDWIEAKVTFVEPSLDLQSEVNETSLDGLCARKGSKLLFWQLDDGQGESLTGGEAQCVGGGFNLIVDQLQYLNCDADYWLWVTTPEGEGSALRVRKRCPAVLAEPLETAAGGRESCFMELVEREDGMSCQKVCYMEGRVYYQNNEDLGSCRHIQANAGGI